MSNSTIQKVKLGNEFYFKIGHSDHLRPFFMSIVSDSNHWMFISSNGGLTAGRKNAEYALFPYYTDDKITESSEYTGSKSIFHIHKNGKIHVWEPFSKRNQGLFQVERNLYKSQYGNKIRFEEINKDLEVSFSYEWCSSNLYGFVRKARLTNLSDQEIHVELVDGLQNIMPFGVPTSLQNTGSNLVNAYKRNELHHKSGLGIFALSAIIVDKAEPSEALKANVTWSYGLDKPAHLLSSLQLQKFRKKGPIHPEKDMKGERGSYLVHSKFNLTGKSEKSWLIVANVNQTQSGIIQLIDFITSNPNVESILEQDINLGTKKLIKLNAASDALHCTSDQLRDTRHYSNVLFNIMRGGIFDNNYKIETWDFELYLKNANKKVYNNNKEKIDEFPAEFTLQRLQTYLENFNDPDFKRLGLEYLPLKFSRRHGDPSRPWNKFSINTINEKDGSKILDYEGNWRDIFQNWEALVHSYPDFILGMIFKFLNASTFDGYNPYRVTKGGFDWEVIEPDDPWSYIGYWGDHQIIYLLKFLEFIETHQPGELNKLFDEELFVYANVPYRIKSYQDIVKNPKDTIDFDHDADEKIRTQINSLGADGALVRDENGNIHRVNFIEKILATLLAKISNYIPDGGIWMNTQRPEWNDANNALVGNGVSMVTLYYIRRFLKFFLEILKKSGLKEIRISNELMNFYKQTRSIFEDNEALVNSPVNGVQRKNFVDKLGQAASDYRSHIYRQSFWGKKRSISIEGLIHFFEEVLEHTDATIQSNKRDDNLYHAYNLVTIQSESMEISYLSEMLEGQVAVLSACCLSSREALKVLDALKSSALFRHDQYSYILYPNKELPGFLDKNNIPKECINDSVLVKKLLEDGNHQIIEKDIKGTFHFNGNFRNVNDLNKALDELEDTTYAKEVQRDRSLLNDVFEEIFDHKSFTGRSGTFYGYEGLGSIYWHMVSKLLLAVQECCLKAIEEKEDASTIGRLLEHFYEINEGIGVHKSPELYGAFPTDPYSHTPATKGAQQPGMTGQVKEDIISRFGELGVFVKNGQIYFYPCLLRKSEFLTSEKEFKYIDLDNNTSTISLTPDSLAFTYCQIPVVYHISDQERLLIAFKDGTEHSYQDARVDHKMSDSIFKRKGEINRIDVFINKEILR